MESLSNYENALLRSIERFELSELKRIFDRHRGLINKYDEFGWTPVMIAVYRQIPEEYVIELMKWVIPEHVKYKDHSGFTILHFMAFSGYTRALTDALEISNDTVNAQNNKGQTPLHRCLVSDGTYNEHIEITKVLLENGAVTTLRDMNGDTPVDCYIRNQCIEYDENQREQKKQEILKILEPSIPSIMLARGVETIKAYKDEIEKGKTTLGYFNIVVLGDEGVGKTSCVNRILGKKFNLHEPSTNGIVRTIVFRTVDGVWKQQENVDESGITKTIFQNTVAKHVAKKIQTFNKNERIESASLYNPHHRRTPDFANSLDELQDIKTLNLEDKEKEHEDIIPEEIRCKIFDEVKKTTIGSEVDRSKELTIIMDFAGQEIYHITHRFYLTNGSIYIVAFSLVDKLNDLAKPRHPKKGVFRRTNLQVIVFWIRSIYEFAILPYNSNKAINGVALPIICLVGTHKDKLKGSDDEKEKEIKEIFNKILDEIKSMPYEKHVDSVIHVVDNTDESDEGIKKLKEIIDEYTRKMTNDEIPTSYVDFQSKVQEKAKTELSMPKDEIANIAGDCHISNIETALDYLNGTGIILYSKKNEKLKDTVIINPPMMIDMLTKIITSVNPNFERPLMKKSWNKLNDTGILDKSLLDHVWKNQIERNPDVMNAVLEVMKMFSLLFKRQNQRGNQVFLVPCQMKIATKGLEAKKDDNHTASFYVTPTDFLPDSVYSVLVVRLLDLMEEKLRSTDGLIVKMRQNRSDFDLYDDHRVSLGAVEINKRNALKLEISRIPKVDEQGNERYFEPENHVCLEMLTYLKKQLRTVYGTMEGIGYELCVFCNACQSMQHLHKLDECLKKETILCSGKLMTTARFKRLYAERKPTTQSNPTHQSLAKTLEKPTVKNETQFQDFLIDFCEQYRGDRYLRLRFLLYDHLCVNQLIHSNKRAIHLLNEASRIGLISNNNVKFLSEVSELTRQMSAITCIRNYKKDNQCNEEKGTVLTQYRRTLFKALEEVGKDDLDKLIESYNLEYYEFSTIWDFVLYLETERKLDNTKEKWERFAKNLNGKAKKIMLGINMF